MSDFELALDKIGDAIIAWARPEGWRVSPLTETYPLTDFSTAASIAIAYLCFVFIGKAVMKNFSAVPGLYPLKFVYNILQVMLCSYMAIQAGVEAVRNGYTLLPCEPFNQATPVMGFILYVFYLSKILDFMDTIFIILEKKDKQLSFLHVYHHTSIFLFYWLNVSVGYDGDVFLTIVLNGFIHTMMYTYYFLCLHMDGKDIWWKSALTMGQMVQFMLMNAQALYLIFFRCDSFPRNIIVAYLFYILTLLVLFAMFYVQSYMRPKGDKPAKSKKI